MHGHLHRLWCMHNLCLYPAGNGWPAPFWMYKPYRTDSGRKYQAKLVFVSGFLKHQHEHGYQGIKRTNKKNSFFGGIFFLLVLPITCINQSVMSYHSYSLDCAGWLSTFSSRHLFRLQSSHESQARAANGQDFSVLCGCKFFGRKHALPSTCKNIYVHYIHRERERKKYSKTCIIYI